RTVARDTDRMIIVNHAIVAHFVQRADDLCHVEIAIVHKHLRIFTLAGQRRSEEHTSELQSRFDLVCRLLLEKKKKKKTTKRKINKKKKKKQKYIQHHHQTLHI